MKITLNRGTCRTIEVERINGTSRLCFALTTKDNAHNILDAYYLAKLYGGGYVENDPENSRVWVCDIDDKYIDRIEL